MSVDLWGPNLLLTVSQKRAQMQTNWEVFRTLFAGEGLVGSGTGSIRRVQGLAAYVLGVRV